MAGSRSLSLQIANIGAFVATVLVNALANALALNGRTTGEISDLYPTLITPAGYVFSIWGLIYALLLGFTVFQALPRNRWKQFLAKISFLFVGSSLANISWLFLWHYGQITLSTIPMFALLAMLIMIYLRLQIGKSNVSLSERLLVHLPFSVYLGWITVASIANVAVALTAIGWSRWGLSDVVWAVLVIAVALAITLAVVSIRRDIVYSLVIVWALVGIAARQSENLSIVLAAGIGVGIIVIASAASIIISRLAR